MTKMRMTMNETNLKDKRFYTDYAIQVTSLKQLYHTLYWCDKIGLQWKSGRKYTKKHDGIERDFHSGYDILVLPFKGCYDFSPSYTYKFVTDKWIIRYCKEYLAHEKRQRKK